MARVLMITNFRNDKRFTRHYYNFVGSILTKAICAKAYMDFHSDSYDVDCETDLNLVLDDFTDLHFSNSDQAVLQAEDVELLFMIE